MANIELLKDLLLIVKKENILVDEELKNHTFTHLGGKANFYLTPSSYLEIKNIINLCNEKSVPLTIIGNASNLIVKDGGIRGIVMSLIKCNHITINESRLIAQSGALLTECSKEAYLNSLSGLEFACGIPGSVGGALYMNAGAYGGEIKDILEYCYLINKKGELIKRTCKELDFGYRTSNIKENEEIILEAVFKLKPGNKELIKSIMDDLTIKRVTKQPLEYPSCGSVFKRPSGYFAGKLIQDSGLVGTRIGGAEISKKHAGFIVNIDNATAKDYLSLIELIQKTVKEKFNVNLETEVKIIGED
jgi:UDP-N-acetylmuramate dehydrogenase